MKKLGIIIIIIIKTSVNFSFAQEHFTGIYITASDFLNKKTAHSGIGTKIKLYEVFKRNKITVKTCDSSFSYLKKDVFGFINKKGHSYRFFNNNIYPILNPGEKILIYKKTSGSGMKNSPVVESYFFSKTAESEILALTLKNIQSVFSEDTLFEPFFEVYFKNDHDLSEYDNIHKMYKINRLLELSKIIK